MTDYRAFVSHSFIEADEQLIGKFVTLFDRVSGLDKRFSWDRAIRAEPRSISEKVQNVFENKNVFIGICSKRERVGSEGDMVSYPFLGRLMWDSTLAWKTSDWILQEIGLARGRSCSCIIFVENGVRNPAPLLADIQYIQFDREFPERCFTTFMDMVTNLSPPTEGLKDESAKIGAAPTEEDDERKGRADEGGKDDPKVDHFQPQPDWSRRQYGHALWVAYAISDVPDETAQRIYEAFLKSPLASDDSVRAEWRAENEYVRILFDKSNSIQSLVDCSKENPKNARIQSFLGRAYEQYQLFGDAAAAYRRASSLYDNPIDQIEALGALATILVKSGEKEKANEVISKATTLYNSETEKALLEVMRNYADARSDKILLIAVRERMLQLDPLDHDLRFKLAYAYGDRSENELSLFHYFMIPPSERKEWTWNNMGASYDALRLSARAVDAYRKAVDQKNTLAMRNLAEKYIDAGFIDEAASLCREALALPDYHTNLLGTLNRTKAVPGEEDKKVNEMVDSALICVGFIQEFGRALVRPRVSELPREWQSPDGVLIATLKGNAFAAIGDYEEPVSGLARALTIPGSTVSTIKKRVRYQGQIVGCAISGTVSRSYPESTIGSATTPEPVMLILSDDGQSLRVSEGPTTLKPRIYDIGAR